MRLILKNWLRLSNDWAYLTASLRNVPQIGSMAVYRIGSFYRRLSKHIMAV
ncbi:hypothetical protein yfred0001_17510 [Yersinia frederiksenii ATCC 33641]|nr:hypothetical protein yfred0001_17510 [Yersinia frederiksenii ATCC 33641]